MKKILAIVLAIVMILSMAACGAKKLKLPQRTSRSLLF